MEAQPHLDRRAAALPRRKQACGPLRRLPAEWRLPPLSPRPRRCGESLRVGAHQLQRAPSLSHRSPPHDHPGLGRCGGEREGAPVGERLGLRHSIWRGSRCAAPAPGQGTGACSRHHDHLGVQGGLALGPLSRTAHKAAQAARRDASRGRGSCGGGPHLARDRGLSGGGHHHPGPSARAAASGPRCLVGVCGTGARRQGSGGEG
mmetsp:Transcript_35459/g.70640  ORF Transcript_35459/g.70640 Transcript_35459/m.70640 type:complete len:204 (+) Transcript_35459:553-1164(+)